MDDGTGMDITPIVRVYMFAPVVAHIQGDMKAVLQH